jgi:hypothetical protein
MRSELPEVLFSLFSLSFKSTTGVEPVVAKFAAWPPAAGSVLDRAVGAEGLEPPLVSWRLQIYSLAQSPLCHTPVLPDIASYGTRTRSDSVTSWYAHPYTNEAGCSSGASGGIEPSPRHSQYRVLPLHQTRHQLSGRGGARTLTARFQAATFSKRVRRTDIRLSSNQPMKDEGRRQKDESKARLFLYSSFILLPFPHCPRQDSNPELGVRSAA